RVDARDDLDDAAVMLRDDLDGAPVAHRHLPLVRAPGDGDGAVVVSLEGGAPVGRNALVADDEIELEAAARLVRRERLVEGHLRGAARADLARTAPATTL